MRYTSEPIIRLSFFYSMEFAAVQVWLNLTYWTFTILCPKSSKSVYNGRGGGHILSPHPVWFFFFLKNSLPEVGKLIWNPFLLTGSYTSLQASSLTIETWTQCWRALKGQSMTVNFVLQVSHSNQLLKPDWSFLKHGIDFNLDISIFM